MNRFKQSRLNLFLLLIVCCTFATQYRTVGPNSPYTTVASAVTSLLPLAEDAVIEVYVGENGLTTPMTVEVTPDFNGHAITIKGVQAELSSATYYVGDEVEFNLDTTAGIPTKHEVCERIMPNTHLLTTRNPSPNTN